MTAIFVVLAALVGLVGGHWLAPRRGVTNGSKADGPRCGRILVPFTGAQISRRALEAAVRLARAEHAVVMPAYLACVPMTLPIDAPVPGQATSAMSLMEAIEQRVTGLGVGVDARVGRGRSYRDALRRLLGAEHVDRVIVAADSDLDARDVAWLLAEAPAEVMILRPDPGDDRVVSGVGVAGHF